VAGARTRVRQSRVQPGYLTAGEQIGWDGINRFSDWDKTLIAERQQKDMRGKGLGLVCHFLKALLDRQVEIVTGIAVRELIVDGGRVLGVVLHDGQPIRAKCGVVLATGGYESNPDLASSFEGVPGWTSQVPSSITGDGLLLGTGAGGAIHLIHNNMTLLLGVRIPVSANPDEAEFHSAGIVELCSPHTIVVNRAGQRFADESYFQAMTPALRHFDPVTHSHPNLPCFLIFDQNYASSYSFGGRPAPRSRIGWRARTASGPLPRNWAWLPRALPEP
jgi:3-oxosteroid 1-dehydrogenase